MRKFIIVSILSICAHTSFGQNTIKFLGIPIDGDIKEMIKALEAKGYEYDSTSDMLWGEFNGNDVGVKIQTVNHKVWRLAIIDATSRDETEIKLRFNMLFNQFLNSEKYYLLDGRELTDDDDISYEMIVHNKRYDATFALTDKSVNGLVWYMIGDASLGKYSIAMFYENYDNAAKGDEL